MAKLKQKTFVKKVHNRYRKKLINKIVIKQLLKNNKILQRTFLKTTTFLKTNFDNRQRIACPLTLQLKSCSLLKKLKNKITSVKTDKMQMNRKRGNKPPNANTISFPL